MEGIMNVTAAVIQRDGLVLIGRRKAGDYYGGYWEFPGGKIEYGETMEECLERELREELGVECIVGPLLTDRVYDYPDRTVRILSFTVEITGGEPEPLEHDEIRWVSPDDLFSFSFVPADIPIVEAVLGLND